MIFVFKQKTAYELRISDWSSDVCSSDLGGDGDVESGKDVREVCGHAEIGKRRRRHVERFAIRWCVSPNDHGLGSPEGDAYERQLNQSSCAQAIRGKTGRIAVPSLEHRAPNHTHAPKSTTPPSPPTPCCSTHHPTT